MGESLTEFKWKGKSRHWIHVAQYTKEVHATLQGSIISIYSFAYVDAILIQTNLSKSHGDKKYLSSNKVLPSF
jgi:hypothetical protein